MSAMGRVRTSRRRFARAESLVRNVWISVGLLAALASEQFQFLVSETILFSFTGCFEREGKNIIFSAGRVTIGGTDGGELSINLAMQPMGVHR